jgi:DNA-binding HxlR family transcriptional regulator
MPDVITISPAIPEDDHGRCHALGAVLDRIGDKWAIMVVGALSRGPMRFNALKRQIGGVSQRMLTLTLRGMVRDGLITRTQHLTIPLRVDYELTELGCSLLGPLISLSDWALANLATIEATRIAHDEAVRKAA